MQIKIKLRGVSKPPVWRRLQVRADTPLDRLHEAIVAAFGWAGYHMHVFTSGPDPLGLPDPELGFIDERRVSLGQLIGGVGDRLPHAQVPARVFPQRFDSIEHARAFCREFFGWYNDEHRHSGISLMTPATVHYRHAEATYAIRSAVLDAAYARNPKRFVRRAPTPVPAAAWINKPNNEEVAH